MNILLNFFGQKLEKKEIKIPFHNHSNLGTLMRDRQTPPVTPRPYPSQLISLLPMEKKIHRCDHNYLNQQNSPNLQPLERLSLLLTPPKSHQVRSTSRVQSSRATRRRPSLAFPFSQCVSKSINIPPHVWKNQRFDLES